MASAVIDTRGMTSTSHNGYVSFSGGSSSGRSGIITSSGSPTGISNNPFTSYSNFKTGRDIANADDFSRGDYTAYLRNNGISNANDYSDLIGALNAQASNQRAENNEQARSNAQVQFLQNMALMREQHRLNENSADKVREFNAWQSKLNREFQERMSNTSHQREIEDLKLAGLNPVLSALNGATTPSGSEATSPLASTGISGVGQAPIDMHTNNAEIIANMIRTILDNTNKQTLEDLGHEHKVTEDKLKYTYEENLNEQVYKQQNKNNIVKGIIDGAFNLGGHLISGLAIGSKIAKNIARNGANSLAPILMPGPLLRANMAKNDGRFY